MNEVEFNKSQICYVCGKCFLHIGVPIFYRVKVELMKPTEDFIKYKGGMDLMKRGSAPHYADYSGEEVTESFGSKEITICHECATAGPLFVPEVLERKE